MNSSVYHSDVLLPIIGSSTSESLADMTIIVISASDTWRVLTLIIVSSFYSTVGKLGVNLQLEVWPRYFPTNLTNLSEGIFEFNCIFILYFKGCSLHLCGSSSNGFGSDSSDADFCFQLRHIRQVRFMYVTFSSTFRSSFLGMPYYFFVCTMYT